MHSRGPGLPEFQLGENISLYLLSVGERPGSVIHFAPHPAHRSRCDVPDVRRDAQELEAKGVVFGGATFDTGVCHMAFFTDPDGNAIMLHRRYAPQS